MTLYISTVSYDHTLWPCPYQLSYDHTIWPCPYQLCLMTSPYDLIHLNLMVMSILTLHYDITLSSYPPGLCLMILSISTVSYDHTLWPCPYQLSYDHTIWLCPYQLCLMTSPYDLIHLNLMVMSILTLHYDITLSSCPPRLCLVTLLYRCHLDNLVHFYHCILWKVSMGVNKFG